MQKLISGSMVAESLPWEVCGSAASEERDFLEEATHEGVEWEPRLSYARRQ